MQPEVGRIEDRRQELIGETIEDIGEDLKR